MWRKEVHNDVVVSGDVGAASKKKRGGCMTVRRIAIVFGICCLLLASQTAWAQTTGSIRGRALDDNGAALPGVTVAVTGEPLGAAQRSTVTSPSGGFQFAAMPIGTYRVTATLDGFQTQAAEDVRVSIGKVASVDFNMPEAFSDEITVTAESPIVDVASPTFNTRFDNEQIIDLPTRGNFYDMIAMTPGVTQDGEGSSWVSAFGSDVKSNQWNIDGLDRTSPEGGDLSWSMNDEMVQEIQVLGTGASAEYGGMSGTAFNVVTKSGTNEWHGSAALDYWPSSWVDENARVDDAPEGAQTYRLDHHNNLSMTFGGPIKRDVLWFFHGAEWGRFMAFDPYDVELPEHKESYWNNYDGKLTAQLAQNHRLNLTINSRDYLGPSIGDIFSEPTTWQESFNKHLMIALDYTAILGEKTVLEARGGVWDGDNGLQPQYPTDEPQFVDWTVYPYEYFGGTWWDWEWEQHRDDLEAIITQHADDFIKGDHEFRFGVQYNRGGGTTKAFRPEYYYQREYEYYPGYPYVYQYWYTGLPYYYGGESESIGVFVTDSWTLSNRLTLDIGVRYDKHKGWINDFNRLDKDSNPTGEVIPGRDMVDWDNVDPRLGFAWQPTDTGRSVIRGSIGQFTSGMTSGDWYSPPPDVSPWGTYWLNWDNEWELLWLWETTPDAFLIPGTSNATTWEVTLGYDQQLTASSAITVQAVYKETKDQIGWYIDDDGEFEWFSYTDPETGQVFQLKDYSVEPTRFKGNSTGPGAVGGDRPYEQDYVGFFVTYTKRFSNNWDLMASYSYSQAEGLSPRHFTGNEWSGQGSVFYANRQDADPNAFINADKTLAGDRRHILRLVGNWMLPYQFKISSVVNIQSGQVYDRQQDVRLPNRGTTSIVTSPSSDSQRLPTQYLWDLGVGKHFNLGRGTDFSIDLQILNLLNDDSVEWWEDLNYPIGEQPRAGGWVLPRRAQLRFRVSF